MTIKKFIISLRAKSRKPMLKGKRIANRISNNIEDYFEEDRKNALKFKRTRKIKL